MSRKTLAILCGVTFLLSSLFFWQRMGEAYSFSLKMGGEDLGKLCVAQAYPVAARGTPKEQTGTASTKQTAQKEQTQKETSKETEKETAKKTGSKEKKQVKKADNENPDLIIYHTHSSESYQPYSKSNFHTENVEGSVREVGEVMTKELQSLGIGVIHDKTVHDRPSYNESYDRSLETVVSLQKKYPSAKYIIDLHRDAAAYSGNKGKTTTIDGKTVAKFSMVVGQNNANYHKLLEYANKVNRKAEALYPGFGGRIIEKTYRYNEYIADNYILLEIGNNQNTIEEVKKTGTYFARVLAEVIEEDKNTK